MTTAMIDRTVQTVERSHDEKTLDEKIQRCNDHNTDPWAKFRASLSIGRGKRAA